VAAIMTNLSDFLQWIKEEHPKKDTQIQFNINSFESFEVGAVYIERDVMHVDLDPIQTGECP
jgi:hypothetical protein